MGYNTNSELTSIGRNVESFVKANLFTIVGAETPYEDSKVKPLIVKFQTPLEADLSPNFKGTQNTSPDL